MSTGVADPVLAKPRLRGVLHQWAAACALGAGAVLVAMAPTARSAAAAALYSASLVTLFGISATYHRINWSPARRAFMRRLDHASIFLLIAGTYTPVALLGLPPQTGDTMLLAIWAGAAVGVAQSLFWKNAPKLVNAGIAVGVGWIMAPYFGDVGRALGGSVLTLILLGGLAYTAGAVAYATKRPVFRPAVFGYHEFFHALTIVGAALHFAAIIQTLHHVR